MIRSVARQFLGPWLDGDNERRITIYIYFERPTCDRASSQLYTYWLLNDFLKPRPLIFKLQIVNLQDRRLEFTVAAYA